MNNQIRHAFRSLLLKPISTFTPIAILALGIGATTAIFNILDAALLRPLQGVSRPSELVLFQRVQDGQLLGNLGYPEYVEYRQHSGLLNGVAATGRASLNYTHGEVTDRITGAVVSGNYFTVLGVEPAVGRLIAPGDESGKLENAVISYSLWQRDF